MTTPINNNNRLWQLLNTSVPASTAVSLTLYAHFKTSDLYYEMPYSAGILAASFTLMIFSGRKYYQGLLTGLSRKAKTCIDRYYHQNQTKIGHLQAMATLVSLNSLSAFTYAALVYSKALNDPDMKVDMLSSPFWMFFALSISHNLKAWLKQRMSQATSTQIKELEALIPATSLRFIYRGHSAVAQAQVDTPLCSEQNIQTKDIQKGYTLRIDPGCLVPVDGYAMQSARLQEDYFLSGEQREHRLSAGELVHQGMRNIGTQAILIRAGKKSRDSELYKIILAGRTRKDTRSDVDTKVDKITQHFLTAVVLISLTSFAANSIIHNMQQAAKYMINILYAACPCTLEYAVSMPKSVLQAFCYSHNIYLQSPEVLATLKHVTHIIFDKTGTLTNLSYERFNTMNSTVSQNIPLQRILRDLQIARLQESQDKSDIYAQTIIDNIEHLDSDEKYAPPILTERNSQGMTATWGGHRFVVGSHSYLNSKCPDIKIEASLTTNTTMFMAMDQSLVANIKFSQQIRAGVPALISTLKAKGFALTILSGDNPEAVKSIAQQLDIKNYEGSMLPADKARAVRKLQDSGQTVLFCGDSANDIKAARQADVSVGLANNDLRFGFDLSINNFDNFPILFQLQSLLEVYQKYALGFAMSYLTSAITLTALVLPLLQIQLTPILFGVSMAFSSTLIMAYTATMKPMLAKQLQQEPSANIPQVKRKEPTLASDHTALLFDQKQHYSDSHSIMRQRYALEIEITSATCFACQATVIGVLNSDECDLATYDADILANETDFKKINVEFFANDDENAQAISENIKAAIEELYGCKIILTSLDTLNGEHPHPTVTDEEIIAQFHKWASANP